MYDMHTHTDFSDDGAFSMTDMANAAMEKGLSAICFTDHLDMDYPSREIQFLFKYDEYMEELFRSRERFASKGGSFQLLSGIELGLQPHVLEESSAFLKNRDFDFVIGSIHVAKGVDMYSNAYRRLGDSETLLDFYFEDLLSCVKNYRDYDVVGHLDVIRRYLHRKDQDYSFAREKERLAEILKAIIAGGRGIEVNTSGLRYHLDSSTPGFDIVKLYRDLGGEIITLGSDAHRPEDTGYKFRETAEMIKSCGFEHAAYFKKRKPVFYKL